MPLHVSSTVVLIIRRVKLYYIASDITLCRWPSGAQVETSLNLCTGRPPTGVMIPDALSHNFNRLMMSTTVLETCRGI